MHVRQTQQRNHAEKAKTAGAQPNARAPASAQSIQAIAQRIALVLARARRNASGSQHDKHDVTVARRRVSRPHADSPSVTSSPAIGAPKMPGIQQQ